MSWMLIDPQEADTEQCPICLDLLNNEQVYELPECNHKYHTNCIFRWIRSGNVNCPYCGNTGECDNNSDYRYGNYSNEQYKILRLNSRKKNAPIRLKKQVEQLKKLEQKQKDIRTEYKELSNKTGTFKEIKKLDRQSRIKKWTISNQIRRMKKNICKNNRITSLILIKKKYIN